MGFYSASPGQARVEDPQWVHHCLSTCSIFSLRPLSKKKPSLSTSRSARPIDRMVGVQRPPIQSNVGAKPARLDHPLRRIMAPFAQAHERTEPEFIDVPTMRLDVITDFCRRDDAALQTELAERMREQLLLPDPPPATGAVPSVPLRRLAATSHSTQPFIRLSAPGRGTSGSSRVQVGHLALSRSPMAASRASATILAWSTAVNLPARRRMRPSTITVSTFVGRPSETIAS
jgi:hypothetical protein